MKPELVFDAEIFPPFQGFPREGLAFLKRLKRNNNREWFSKHKIEYEELVKLPMQSLIVSLSGPMSKLVPEIDVNPKRSMFRIYRDTRFSSDKTPYKTHVAAVFHLRGHWQDSAGYYLHIEPGGVYLGGGIYMPNGDQLKRIRRAIDERADQFRSIVESKKFVVRFGTLEGEKLQRGPAGFSPDHPMIEWLKYKSFYTGVDWNEEESYSARLVDKTIEVYRDLLPMIRFLNEALGKSVK
jgi:uncharacterized protein (TIGR02453 family)